MMTIPLVETYINDSRNILDASENLWRRTSMWGGLRRR
jgi:hypothetical protein